ncbi:IclR family transcriptional regulator [Arthrobacter sp. 9V]|uniref:IclR family transcriptional regulator n=1 Tax=Arthrobacter sp. 9V TaxID=2653132 RepID=UPI0012F1EB0F|nr:IclR family transcriptional regulator [Arthrobacter sp. 9V]VXC43508.1 IclR family transcriptional regulator [Arthrobacter sp. 9V]
MAEDRKTYKDGNSTADRALTILGLFSDARATISATEVASELGVTRSTAYRYLQTLVGSAFLQEGPKSGFRLGPRILELARIARRGNGLSDLALPKMEALAIQFQQTVLLTGRSGPAVICLECEEWSGQYVRFSYERGSRLSINAGAAALTLLAWLPEEEVRALLSREPLQRYSPHTLTDIDSIVDRLAQIRRDGHSITRGEVDAEAMGIAAPVFGPGGDVVAALSFVLLQSRLPEEQLPRMTEALKFQAAELTRSLNLYAG